MGEMNMPVAPNSLPMRGTQGPHSYIDMGGMFTTLKVREPGESLQPGGWYQQPAGTAPYKATPAQMQADGSSPAQVGR